MAPDGGPDSTERAWFAFSKIHRSKARELVSTAEVPDLTMSYGAFKLSSNMLPHILKRFHVMCH